jgi:hypothetical protein
MDPLPANSLEVRQNLPDRLGIRAVNQTGFSEITFSFSRFLGQNVAAEGLVTLDLARSRRFEPFGSASVCFHFGHDTYSFNRQNKTVTTSQAVGWGRPTLVSGGKPLLFL